MSRGIIAGKVREGRRSVVPQGDFFHKGLKQGFIY